MVFNKSGRKLNINCKFGQQKVDVAKSYMHLGCGLTPSGAYSANQDKLYNKGLRALFNLLKDFQPQKGTPVRLFLKLFDSLVKPILLYNCEIWGAYTSRNPSFQLFKEKLFQTNIMCEELEIKMYKIILGVNAKTPNSGVRSELGRFPMHIPILSSILKYLYHLLSDHSDSPLLMNALKTSISLHRNGTVS